MATPLTMTSRRLQPAARVAQRQVAAVVGFAVLVALGARLSVPLLPVPMTLQVPFVLLAGAFLGARRGASSMALYLGAGALGLPVFAAGGGLPYLLGPTGGYLVGFLPAAALVGLLTHGRRRFLRLVLAMTAGMLVLHALGALHLMLISGRSLAAALEAGLLPFVLGDLLKIGGAAALAAAWPSRRPRED